MRSAPLRARHRLTFLRLHKLAVAPRANGARLAAPPAPAARLPDALLKRVAPKTPARFLPLSRSCARAKAVNSGCTIMLLPNTASVWHRCESGNGMLTRPPTHHRDQMPKQKNPVAMLIGVLEHFLVRLPGKP